jgi:hypothetical protein
MNEKEHNMYIHPELTTIRMEWNMVAKYARNSTDSLHYWWRAGWLTSPGVSDPLISYSQESGDRYINGYLDIADSKLEAKEDDKKSLITKINKTTRRNHYLENWKNVINYINNIDWYFQNKAYRTDEPMFVVRYADYVKNLDIDNHTVWKRYLSTSSSIWKVLSSFGPVGKPNNKNKKIIIYNVDKTPIWILGWYRVARGDLCISVYWLNTLSMTNYMLRCDTPFHTQISLLWAFAKYPISCPI